MRKITYLNPLEAPGFTKDLKDVFTVFILLFFFLFSVFVEARHDSAGNTEASGTAFIPKIAVISLPKTSENILGKLRKSVWELRSHRTDARIYDKLVNARLCSKIYFPVAGKSGKSSIPKKAEYLTLNDNTEGSEGKLNIDILKITAYHVSGIRGLYLSFFAEERWASCLYPHISLKNMVPCYRYLFLEGDDFSRPPPYAFK